MAADVLQHINYITCVTQPIYLISVCRIQKRDQSDKKCFAFVSLLKCVWGLIVLIPDLCPLSYSNGWFHLLKNSIIDITFEIIRYHAFRDILTWSSPFGKVTV